jgi:hypothetical protein
MKRIVNVTITVGEAWDTWRYLREVVFVRPFWRTAGAPALDCAIKVLTATSTLPPPELLDVTDQEHEWISRECQLPDTTVNPAMMLVILTHIRAISGALPPPAA